MTLVPRVRQQRVLQEGSLCAPPATADRPSENNGKSQTGEANPPNTGTRSLRRPWALTGLRSDPRLRLHFPFPSAREGSWLVDAQEDECRAKHLIPHSARSPFLGARDAWQHCRANERVPALRGLRLARPWVRAGNVVEFAPHGPSGGFHDKCVFVLLESSSKTRAAMLRQTSDRASPRECAIARGCKRGAPRGSVPARSTGSRRARYPRLAVVRANLRARWLARCELLLGWVGALPPRSDRRLR